MAAGGYQHPVTFTATGDVARDFAHALAAYDKDVRHLLPRTRDRPILDVGCGWGQFLFWLRHRGYTAAVGIDIGLPQVDFCRSLGLDVTVTSDSVQYLWASPDRYDLITLHHVIEHLHASAGLELLQAAYGALRPGGRILVQTPNMSAASASVSRHIELSHETGYTETSLAEILQLAAFEGVHIFGNRPPFTLRPKRMGWLAMRFFTRAVWRALLLAELGTDTPRILAKNLFGTGLRPSLVTPESLPGRPDGGAGR